MGKENIEVGNVMYDIVIINPCHLFEEMDSHFLH